MQFFLAGILILIGVILIARWFATASPAAVLSVLKFAGILTGLVVIGLLAVSGRIAPALAVLAALVPLLLRSQMLLRQWKTARGPSPGQTSRVRTAMLETWLDHDSGSMDGVVLSGVHQGRTLSDLSLDELLELLADARQSDEQSLALLEAYLDRTYPDDWRDRDSGRGARADGGRSGRSRSAGGDGATMSHEEALAFLGLESDATVEEIKARHRDLMKRFHPDHGGSSYLAAKLNEAKDVLLKRR